MSIGAITAAVLGGARTDPISALDALWRAKLTVAAPTGLLGLPAQVDRSLALLGNPGMYQLRAGLFTTPWLLTSFYDTAPLRHTLAELVDPARLNADDPRVIVGATNVGTGEMEFFDRDRPGGLTFEHVAASGSLPPSFPMTDIEGSRTGTGACSPTPRSARRSTHSSRRRTATARWSASSSSSSCSRCGRRCRRRCTTSCNG